MTEKELINQGYKLHHTAMKSGYISRKNKDGIIENMMVGLEKASQFQNQILNQHVTIL